MIKIMLFLAAFLGLSMAAHLFFYKTMVRLFMLVNPAFKATFFVIVMLLSLSFMASFFLLRWQENPWTVGFYVVSATWMGLFINLLLAVLLSWIIVAAVGIAGGHTNTRMIASGCLILAVLFSAYGAWNASYPRVKTIEFEFKNLPTSWENNKIVQLSDVHLGHVYNVAYLRKLVGRVNTIRPDIIFITGDLFDGMVAKIERFAEVLNMLTAKKGVFFVTGNHENYVGLQRVLHVIKKTKITILHNEAIEIDGMQIIGISYPGIKAAAEIQGLENPQSFSSNNKPRLLLFHTPTNITPKGGDGLKRHFATYWVPDTSFALAKKLAVDLQLSGHAHAGQIFPFGYLTKLLYKGYDYGLKHNDDFYIYTTSGVGTWGPPMRTGNTPEIVVIKVN